MTMSTLMCPHCGGRLLIDPTQRLQSMLSCPYCGRKSLMQKKNGMIVLRGIISQATPPKTPADEEQALKQLDPDYRLHADTVELPVDQHTEKKELPQDLHTDIAELQEEPHDDVLSFNVQIADELPVAFPASDEQVQTIATAAEEEPVKEVPKNENIPDEAQAAIAVPEENDKEPEPAVNPVNDLVIAEPSEAVKTEADISSLFSVMPTIDVPDTAEPTLKPVEEPLPEAPEEQPTQPAFVQPVPEKPAPQIPAQQGSSDLSADKERLIALAARMAASGQIPAFNSYARRAIDCDPTDPRVYALRARLIEEAHGFARSTFLSPVWLDQTPRQKSWIIAQHFSSLNAAVTYSTDSERQSLAAEAGALIAWQIRETFVENARIRLGKRPFNGRFQRTDLRTAPPIIDACMSINETVVPHVSGDLLRSVRQTLAKLDPRLADRLQRIGF